MIGWGIYVAIGILFFIWIAKRHDDIEPRVGCLAYALFLAFSIGGAVYLGGGKSTGSSDYQECGSGRFKYDC